MFRPLGKGMLSISACTVLVLSGRPLDATTRPSVPPSTQALSNPLRGQYEDLLEPLFPQGNPAQHRYPPWPAAHDGSLRVTWRQLEPTDPRTLPLDAPDGQKFDFRTIDDALTKLAARNMRLTLRVVAYSSCCDTVFPDATNIEVPDWVRAIPGATTSYRGPSDGPAAGVTQVVPNWNDTNYLDAFGRLVAALGRRYDGDERLSAFEFSGYGDWSENHIAYLRDKLGAPGPQPDDSEAELGYYSQFADQSITAASIRYLVAAHVSAFPRTQLMTAALNPEIVRQLLADDVTKKLSAPVGIRADCLGVQAPLPAWAEAEGSYYVESADPIVTELKRRLVAAPVITEWCLLPEGVDPRSYYEKGLHDVIKYHVSMTSSCDFADTQSTTPMDPALYLLWAWANADAGYRYSVEARPRSLSIQGKTASTSLVWTNSGSAAATEKWLPRYQLTDAAGAVVKTLPAMVSLKTLVPYDAGQSREQPVPVSVAEPVHIDLVGLTPGHYTLQASVSWQQHKPNASRVVDYPPMELASDGRDGSGRYPIATLDIPRNALAAVPQR
ncbi:hypothetical protein [Mycobacterium shigaense]|uniref:hypothetical protein n=1 Tax=Mycobacterium shigaense TaxID=722731 RepID=UPI00196972C0